MTKSFDTPASSASVGTTARVALLTGGGDRPYALGMARALALRGIRLDFIGSSELEAADLLNSPDIRFLNLRGDVSRSASRLVKIRRTLQYYSRLMGYAISAKPKIFHLLWNNRLEAFDRTVLMLYYRALGRRLILTVHNVNARKRDGGDGLFNRWTLWSQYHLVDHLFVHTALMKAELTTDFGVAPDRISVIPFGLNETVPNTDMTSSQARARLGLPETAKVLLFFGNIAPYKGLEFLVEALSLLVQRRPDCRLLIAGRPKGHAHYWNDVNALIERLGIRDAVISRPEYIPDEETEVYFKAADVLVLPYVHVFQSGVLFLGYGFGLPVVATNVASLQEDVIEGKTGYTCPPRDAVALADTLNRFFSSELYASMPAKRTTIQQFVRTRNSWTTVADVTSAVYDRLS